uniref:3-hydroxyanthranilate 3,4-dioxygenase n=1 Tax=Panagrellus redivivus TaxID=6233 RepID=A0A7E4UUS0_PANRE
MSCCNDCCLVFNSPKWIEDNKADFAPPVCNKCMFSDQLKVFFIGGPNERNDYHLEEGEEVFFQIEGDMVLKVVENGTHLDIPIKQGEIFLLPGRIEHSPQRFADTVGVVIERTRDSDELDCVRWFVDGTTDVLFERWFHLTDVVADLPPVIREFKASEEAKTGKPGPKAKLREPLFFPVAQKLMTPVNLGKFIDENLDSIKKSPLPMLKDVGSQTTITLYGPGEHNLATGQGELIVMPQRGSANLKCAGSSYALNAFDMARIRPEKSAVLDVATDGVVITVKMVR